MENSLSEGVISIQGITHERRSLWPEIDPEEYIKNILCRTKRSGERYLDLNSGHAWDYFRLLTGHWVLLFVFLSVMI